MLIMSGEIMNNNHYQLLKYCVDNRNIKLWNEIKKECDEYGIIIDLRYVDLNNVYLENVDLKNAILEDANLRYANLWNANLEKADLEDADMRSINLEDANLKNADLKNAKLFNTNLYNADLRGAIWDGIQIVGLKWCIIIIKNQIQIGCKIHSLKEWKNFTDMEINEMNENALDWWKQNKEMIIYMYKNFENKIKK